MKQLPTVYANLHLFGTRIWQGNIVLAGPRMSVLLTLSTVDCHSLES